MDRQFGAKMGLTRRSRASLAGIGVLILSTIAVGFLINDYTKTEIRNSILDEKSTSQMITTKSLGASVQSEFSRLFVDMTMIADSSEIQNSLSDESSKNYLKKMWNKINTVTSVEDIFVVDESFTVVSQANIEKFNLVGFNLENLKDNEQIRLKPTYSGQILSSDKVYRVLVSSPIHAQDGTFLGVVFGIIEPSDIISKYVGIYQINLGSITIFDQQKSILFGQNPDLLGKDYKSEFVQAYYDNNEIQNEHYEQIFAGNSESAIFVANRLGEVISTGTPVSIESQDRFFFIVTTSVRDHLEEINENMFVEDLKNNIILFVITVLFLIVILKRVKGIENEKLVVIGQLASNIAHDIRNPLATIRSSVTRIEKQNKDANDTVKQETERIKRSISRMNHQVEDVLNYVRITPLNLSENSVNELINTCANSLVLPQNIKVNIPTQDIEISCDNDKFRVVIENLILNAAQAIGDNNGEITIKTAQDDENITISFENNGPNIPEEDLEKVFRPLFTSKLKGTGLGLSSCMNIINQHNGTITVTNNPVTFTVKIPKNLRKE
ncbi:MAG: ATP-binding protein [Nitrosopumilus sp.]